MTAVDAQVLDAVRERITTRGYAPSIREIAAETKHGIQTVHASISRLVGEGRLNRVPYRQRGLSLADLPDLRGVPSEALRAELGRRGETFDRIATYERKAFGRAVSCAADSCQIEVKRGQLFCRRHWYSLPHSLQQDIKRAFADGDVDKYQVFVSEARDRIDRADNADAPRRPL